MQPEAVFIDTFEISNNGQQIAYATLPCHSLDVQLNQKKQIFNPKDPNIIESLIKNVISDVEFLWRDLHFKDVINALGPENIYYMKDKETFFLSNWAKLYEVEPKNNIDASTLSSMIPKVEKELTSQTLSNEIKSVAFIALSLKEIDFSELETIKKPRDL